MLGLAGQRLTLEQIWAVAEGEESQLTEDARGRMQAAREIVERIVSEGRVVYGVNTGFGKLSDTRFRRTN